MFLKAVVPRFLINYYHGLKAVLALIYYRYPAQNLTVIGVTGTDGKTTTSTLIYHLLHSAGYKVALISTVAAYIGDQAIDTGFHVTSPDSFALQSLLAKIKAQGFTHVVLEATSHGLDQHRLFGTNIQIGVLTNVTQDHFDYHGDYDHYLQAKAKLFKKARLAILNSTDISFKKIKPHLPEGIKIVPYDLKTLPQSFRRIITKKFPQDYNQLNATAATLTLQHLGVDDQLLLQALPKFSGIPGRLEVLKTDHPAQIVIDFAHTPNSLKHALTHLRKTTSGKLIAVYGAAGLRDRSKRPLMGQIGAQLADEVILTAEDPRTESVHSIINQMAEGVSQNLAHTHKIPDRHQAIAFALKLAGPHDTVAILGKGHEQSMCFGKIEHPWSDKQAVYQILDINQ